MAKKINHIGFKAASASVAKKQGVSMESANKIIASGARNASPKAKASNKKLLKVSGNKKPPMM